MTIAHFAGGLKMGGARVASATPAQRPHLSVSQKQRKYISGPQTCLLEFNLSCGVFRVFILLLGCFQLLANGARRPGWRGKKTAKSENSV